MNFLPHDVLHCISLLLNPYALSICTNMVSLYDDNWFREKLQLLYYYPLWLRTTYKDLYKQYIKEYGIYSYDFDFAAYISQGVKVVGLPNASMVLTFNGDLLLFYDEEEELYYTNVVDLADSFFITEHTLRYFWEEDDMTVVHRAEYTSEQTFSAIAASNSVYCEVYCKAVVIFTAYYAQGEYQFKYISAEQYRRPVGYGPETRLDSFGILSFNNIPIATGISRASPYSLYFQDGTVSTYWTGLRDNVPYISTSPIDFECPSCCNIITDVCWNQRLWYLFDNGLLMASDAEYLVVPTAEKVCDIICSDGYYYLYTA